MNPRTTAILALVVASLGAFVYFYEIRGAERRADAEAEGRRLFPRLEASAIDRVELRTSDGQDAVVERQEGGWRLREPRDFPANDAAVESLAESLAGLASEAAFEEPAPLEDYGLGEEVRVRFRAGDREYALRVGDKTPVGGNTYVATGEDAPVYTVATYLANGFTKSYEQLQDKQIVDFDPAAVRSLDLSWPGGGVRLARAEAPEGEGDAAGWRLLAPIEGEADGVTVEGLLSTLDSLTASGFINDPPSDAELGLEAPEFRAELELAPAPDAEEGAEPTRLQVVVGATLDGANRAVRGGEPEVRYSIPTERLDRMPRKVGLYRFRDLARFDSAEARRLELVFQDDAAGQSVAVTAERTPSGWTSEPEAVSPPKLSSLVARLARLRAEDVLAERMGEAELAVLGLQPPRVQLRVFGEKPAGEGAEAPLLADVTLGRPALGQGIPARRTGQDVVYFVDYDLAEHIPINLAALRNRFLEGAGSDPEPEPDLELDFDPPEEDAGPEPGLLDAEL